MTSVDTSKRDWWRDPAQIRAAAHEIFVRSRSEQGLPPQIENEAVLDRLATLIDVDPVVDPAVKRGAA